MQRIWVKPYSLERWALSATENTLRTLHRGGSFVVEDGHLLTQNGWVAVDVMDAGFVMWASVRQGYVQDASLTPGRSE